MNGSLLVVAMLAACGLAGGLARLAEHHRGRPARPVSGGRGGNVLDALVIDPLTEHELLLATLDHGAESLAVMLAEEPEVWREDTDETARVIWEKYFDQQLADLNAQFDALNAGYDPLNPVPASYWPGTRPVSSVPSVYVAMSHFDPNATIQVITAELEQAAATPTTFSWTTGEYPMQRAPGGHVQTATMGAATLVREAPHRLKPSVHGRGRHARRWLN